MTTTSYFKRREYPYGGTRVYLNYLNETTNSPRVDGKLVLRSNYHVFRRVQETEFWVHPDFAFPVALDAQYGIIEADSDFQSLINVCLAKFSSRVRKHNASLGVTLASWGQTRDMITSRSQKIAGIFGHLSQVIAHNSVKKNKRIAVDGTANAVLEGMFGWVPLIQDIQSGFNALARPAPPGWISVSHKGAYRREVKNIGYPFAYDQITEKSGDLKVTIGASVRVTNPNLFLANRLGLINLPGVAWDLVPWSFVVNLFTNCGQLVNSLTDFVGVDILNTSTTRSSLLTRRIVNVAGRQAGQYPTTGSSSSLCKETWKHRTVGGLPSPSFELRVPQLDFGLAAIAWSLIGQRIGKINSLIQR